MIGKWHVPAVLAAGLAVGTLFSVSELSAQSGDTRTMQVTATVKGSCRFDATPNINFGDLDPSTPTDKNQAVDVTFKCTKGVAYTLTVGAGLNASGGKNRMKSASGTEYIPYEITPKTQAGTGTGFGTSAKIQISGAVIGADYQNVAAGSYADTVTLSIQP